MNMIALSVFCRMKIELNDYFERERERERANLFSNSYIENIQKKEIQNKEGEERNSKSINTTQEM